MTNAINPITGRALGQRLPCPKITGPKITICCPAERRRATPESKGRPVSGESAVSDPRRRIYKYDIVQPVLLRARARTHRRPPPTQPSLGDLNSPIFILNACSCSMACSTDIDGAAFRDPTNGGASCISLKNETTAASDCWEDEPARKWRKPPSDL